MDTIFERVKKITVKKLKVKEENVVPTSNFKMDFGADSLDFTEIIMAIEEEFSTAENRVKIPDEVATKINTIQDAVDYLNDMETATNFNEQLYAKKISINNPEKILAPPISSSESAKLITSAGNRCENPTCRIAHPLEIHHIKPRSEGGTNKWFNLIVLCPNCHTLADRGVYSRELLLKWVQTNRENET